MVTVLQERREERGEGGGARVVDLFPHTIGDCVRAGSGGVGRLCEGEGDLLLTKRKVVRVGR